MADVIAKPFRVLVASLFTTLVCLWMPTHASRLHLTKTNAPDALADFLKHDADTLVIGPRPGGWVTSPLKLAYSRQTVIFLPGAEVRAKPGAFTGLNDVLLLIENLEDVKVIGYGARLVMNKREYTAGEWRHGISIRGSQRIRIEGLAIDSSGGDGIYIDGAEKGMPYSRDVLIETVKVGGHRRQGISVVSVDGLIVKDSRFVNTHGTNPAAGIDFEPDNEAQRLRNCLIENSIFTGNHGPQALIDLRRLTGESDPVSIRFVDNLFEGHTHENGVLVRAFRGSVNNGEIRFIRNEFRNSGGPTLTVRASIKGKASIQFDSNLFDGASPNSFLRSPGPVISFNQTRAHNNPSGLTESAHFKAALIRTFGRPVFAVANSNVLPARAISMEAYLGDSVPPPPITGIHWAALSRAPQWGAPKPVVSALAWRGHRLTIWLNSWQPNPVQYAVNGRKWAVGKGTVQLNIKPDDTIKAVTISHMTSRDTLVWVVPAYLRFLNAN